MYLNTIHKREHTILKMDKIVSQHKFHAMSMHKMLKVFPLKLELTYELTDSNDHYVNIPNQQLDKASQE